ncbi:signal transduction histidine-protein kinase BarA [Candidatus Phycosocius bacilliformis]|uniref:histidine kinase n=1 Tax=Candidatus Phycosocius bacilliformis TaxID=1445552 RepID=A0A2P2ECH1_9PROT|nr:ATP-binding protein [Candidatus Phycosocius bacilliformis]GBF58755.1 signal transduction histidine-protein kinase BarA [Candidatus Phycosocius bacilliformis]
MTTLTFALSDLPDCAVLAGKNGRVLDANPLAQECFGEQVGLGAFAPWFDARAGWHVQDREDGSQLGLYRPDADETARSKTMLFATLSHEIRTPLNGILGMAGLLSMSELSSAQRTWLGAVTDSGQRLLALLNDILDYAKLESGKIELETMVFNPAKTLQSVAELCSPRAHEKNIEIALAVAPDVPIEVAGDDGRLRQIILNLAANAVKFTYEGGVLLRLETLGANKLRFSVEDTGIGIPDDKVERIFEEFHQADSSHTRRFGGTGLGLAIVKKLSNALGGSVHLTHREGGGSRFWVDIPFETITPAPSPTPRLTGKTVAIHSQSALLIEALSMALENEGAKVKKAITPRQARDADVILLDHHTDTVKAAPWLKCDSPVVALIPQERRDLIEDYRAKGAIGYLIKPLRIASLIERVELAAGAVIDQRPATATDERADAMPLAIGLRVLLAEDNPINALLAKSLLMRNGCHVVTVGNGAEAVTALQDAPYDLVLMDVHMPVMDGFEATRAVRAMGGRVAQTPIIALTAAAMEEDRRACKNAGMDDFITKPLDPAMLSSVLERWTKPTRQATFAA